MIARITAEFEAPELAESALMRIKETVSYVYKTGIIYNKKAENARKLRNGTMYTVMPTAAVSFNYFTAVLESPTSEDVVPEPSRSRVTGAFVICEDSSQRDVSAVFHAMGGLNVRCGK